MIPFCHFDFLYNDVHWGTWKWPNPIILENGDGIFLIPGAIIFSHEKLSRSSEEGAIIETEKENVSAF